MKLLTQWAVTSSALILIVLAARYVLRNKLSARLKYALWGVVLLRLLVPFQVELPASVSGSLPVLASNFTPEVADVELYALRTYSRPLSEDNLAEMRERGVDPGTVIGTEAPIHQIGDVEIEGYAHCFVLSDTGIDTYFFYTTLPKFLMTLWIIGAVWVALTIFRSNRYFYGRLKYYRHELAGAEAPIPVYTAANLSSPCLFGVFQPAVYVTPEAAERPDALRHVLAHELTHYAHRDHIWSLLRCLALVLHWYNPLVWLAVALSKGDGELACDEGAVARLGEAERIPYGRTLVDMVAARSLRPADLLSCSTAMTGGGKSVKRRVAQIVKKPETVKAALFAAVAVVALAAVFVFAGRVHVTTYEELCRMTQDDLIVRVRTGSEAESVSFHMGVNPNLQSILRSGTAKGGTCSAPELVPDALELIFPVYDQDGTYRTYHLVETGRGCELVTSRFGGRDTIYYNQRIAVFPDGTAEKIKVLAQEQGTNASPFFDWDRFLADLEAAQSIYVGQPMISSAMPPGLISDPEAVAQAKELLRKASPPIQLPEGVTREEFWESIRPFLSSTEYQDMEEPPTLTQKDLETMLFMRGSPIDLCPGTGYQFSKERRYWLADNSLLRWDMELEENSIKLLATFSEDVYSQLAGLARTNKNLLRDVLLGQAQFQFVSEEGRVSAMDIHTVPSIFSPSSSYAALGEFAVVDLDGDGVREVVVHTADVGGDMTGYLVLRQKDGEIYGYPYGWRTFWNLKTDGTFDYSLWNGSEDGTARLYFSDGGGPYFGCTLLAMGPGNGADFDTFLVNGNNTTEEEYRRAVREQQAKPDAVWYDFTEVKIRAMLP